MLTWIKGLVVTLSCVAASFTVTPASAWPDKPIRLIVGFGAGGVADIGARMLAERIRPHLGNVQIIIDNKPGQGGALGVQALKAATDDHTFMLFSDDLLLRSLASRSAGYEPLTDFKLVGTIADGTLVLVAGPSAPFRSFDDFVKHGRANPGMTYLTPGITTQAHLAMEYLSTTLGLKLRHVDVKSGGVAENELEDGTHMIAALGSALVLPHLAKGDFKPLAILTANRAEKMPTVPTIAELGLAPMPVVQRGGLVAPKSTPDAVVESMAAALAAALQDPTLRQRFEAIGGKARVSTPAAYTAETQRAAAAWKKFIDDNRLAID